MGANTHPADEDGKKKGAIWEKTPTPNLVRYKGGTYFLRGRFGGEPIRESLKTDNYRVAKVKLADRMRELRDTLGKRNEAPETVLDAVRVIRRRIEQNPSIKANTRRSYLEELDSMEPGKSAAVPMERLSRLNEAHLGEWWAKVAKAYAPQRANHILMFLKRAVNEGRKFGVVRGDPFEHIKRVKIPRTRLKLITADQFRELVESIRGQGKANSEDAANWVEFMAYSGLRPNEQNALKWRDIFEAAREIRVYGGVEGPKNREFRTVPMVPAMVDLIRSMRKEGQKPEDPLFRIRNPRAALHNACDRVGVPRMRLYDCRHFFASMCNAAGIDVATFSGWLGHKDGGVLALKTYVHTLDKHNHDAASRVTFR